jgi:NADH-quinone oxidoreductase subunit D/NADH-quinone oxidoreductase subunit C/D
MSDIAQATTVPTLEERFSGKLIPETRSGYQGYIVKSENLIEVATTLRDELGYDYLSSVTAVDYLPEDILEVVYHFYKSTGGGALVLKVQTPRNASVVSSLTPLFPGAEFQEREVWDLLGVRFDGHPDLRRILTWEGFAGHPLRKDWKEPFYEGDVKPYDSRWPAGHISRAEDNNPFGSNVQYPQGFDPAAWVAEGDDALYRIMKKAEPDSEAEHLGSEQIIVNFGPQHPSTHGVFRMVVSLDGETIVDLKPVMGYLHRNHEKIAERNTFLMNMPFTDRLDYICSMSNNFGYALAVEKLLNIQVPERADYIRVIMAELTRLSNHMIAIGTLLNDMGAYFTSMLYYLEERELILDIFEAVSGSRMMCNYFRFGGVVRDLPDGILEKIKPLVFDRFPRTIDELDVYLTQNEVVRARCEGVGVLTPDQAIAFSAAGPTLRASGVPYDIRRADPYSIYDRFDFDVVVGYHGDVYDRYLVRMEEMRQSIRIIQQAVNTIPEGPILQGAPKYQFRVPAGEAYGRVEGPKGELGFYVISNGKGNPWRYHVRAPSFINVTPLTEMCRGGKVADAIITLGSIDIVLGETDR